MRKFVHALIVRRGPESADAFTAMQLSRLNEALRTSYGAMWETNLATVDRAVGIVRELGRRHGLGGGASGTEPWDCLEIGGAGAEAVISRLIF